jgi:hypothetical protein
VLLPFAAAAAAARRARVGAGVPLVRPRRHVVKSITVLERQRNNLWLGNQGKGTN